MSIEALAMIKEAMSAMGLNYAFMEYKPKSGETLPETYFVGEYHELEPANEDGEEDTIFILNGFSRGKWLRLEEAKGKIKRYFPQAEGRKAATGPGTAIAIFYSNSLPIPVEDGELKRMQINLTVKEWKVEG